MTHQFVNDRFVNAVIVVQHEDKRLVEFLEIVAEASGKDRQGLEGTLRNMT